MLLRRCLEDVDDEVRDRATLALRMLEPSDLPADDSEVPELAQLEASLQQYVESGATEPFDYDSLPRVDRDALEEPEAPDLVRVSEAPAAAAAAPTAMSAPVESADNYGDYAAQLAAVPALAAVPYTHLTLPTKA